VHGAVLSRKRSRSSLSVFVWLCTACATALVFLQVRFVYYAAPLVAALPGAFAFALRARPRGLRAAAVLAALLSLWPVTRFWAPAIDGDPRTELRPLQTSASRWPRTGCSPQLLREVRPCSCVEGFEGGAVGLRPRRARWRHDENMTQRHDCSRLGAQSRVAPKQGVVDLARPS
jgi:hypothetical protein